MKTLYKLCLSALVIFGAYSSSYAQNVTKAFNLGGSKTLVQQIKQQPQASKLKVSPNTAFSIKVNYQSAASSENQSVMGEVTGANPGSFFLQVKGDKLEGNIILPKAKKAYKYSSDKNGNATVEEVDINGVVCIDLEHGPASKAPAASSTPVISQIGAE